MMFLFGGAVSGAAQGDSAATVYQEPHSGKDANPAESSVARDQRNVVPLVTMTFKLQYVRPQNVAEQIREIMGRAPGGVIVNEKKQECEVTAPEETLAKIKTAIQEMDQRRDIQFDIKVVQVDLNEEHPTGINWSAIVSDFKNFVVIDDKRTFSVGTLSTEDYAVLLEALQTVGDTHEHPPTRVTINNGQEADLRLKAFDRDIRVSMAPASDPAVNGAEKQDRYTARFVLDLVAANQEGVDLRFMSVEGNQVAVRVKKNAVAVIGGIFTQTKSQSTKKLPFLGDLPLVGVVFRDQSKVIHRLENIVFLIPRVTAPISETP